MYRLTTRPRFAPVGRALAVATLAAVALAGCYASGRKVDQQTLVDLQPGHTPCLEIRARYGPPTSATIGSGQGEQLTYVYTQGQLSPASLFWPVGMFIGGSTSETTTVTFACDTHGVLQAYTATQGQDTIGTGILSGGKQK